MPWNGWATVCADVGHDGSRGVRDAACGSSESWARAATPFRCPFHAAWVVRRARCYAPRRGLARRRRGKLEFADGRTRRSFVHLERWTCQNCVPSRAHRTGARLRSLQERRSPWLKGAWTCAPVASTTRDQRGSEPQTCPDTARARRVSSAPFALSRRGARENPRRCDDRRHRVRASTASQACTTSLALPTSTARNGAGGGGRSTRALAA